MSLGKNNLIILLKFFKVYGEEFRRRNLSIRVDKRRYRRQPSFEISRHAVLFSNIFLRCENLTVNSLPSDSFCFCTNNFSVYLRNSAPNLDDPFRGHRQVSLRRRLSLLFLLATPVLRSCRNRCLDSVGNQDKRHALATSDRILQFPRNTP